MGDARKGGRIGKRAVMAEILVVQTVAVAVRCALAAVAGIGWLFR